MRLVFIIAVIYSLCTCSVHAKNITLNQIVNCAYYIKGNASDIKQISGRVYNTEGVGAGKYLYVASEKKGSPIDFFRIEESACTTNEIIIKAGMAVVPSEQVIVKKVVAVEENITTPQTEQQTSASQESDEEEVSDTLDQAPTEDIVAVETVPEAAAEITEIESVIIADTEPDTDNNTTPPLNCYESFLCVAQRLIFGDISGKR